MNILAFIQQIQSDVNEGRISPLSAAVFIVNLLTLPCLILCIVFTNWLGCLSCGIVFRTTMWLIWKLSSDTNE